MEPLSFDTFDPATDTLAGTATPGTTVEFGIGNETQGFDGTTTTDATGNWTVDLSTQFDITADMGGQAWISDTDGDQTIAEPPPPPQFQASLTNDWVQGHQFAPSTSLVTFTINAVTPSVPPGGFVTDGDGHFNFGELGVDLVWFGVMMAINLNMAFISPPVGFSLFYLQSVAPEEVETIDIHKGALP